MYAVIFRATVKELDDEYVQTAKRLRELACHAYGCVEFAAVTEGNEEIAISYWKTREDIERWKKDPEHVRAQTLGQEKWYRTYTVQVVEILREYHKDGLQLASLSSTERGRP